MRAVRAGLDGRVDGHRRDGCVRGPAADGPEHRPARPANGRVHCRGDGTALPGRSAGHDLVLCIGRHTCRAHDGHVPRLAASVSLVLHRAVRRLCAHMVHARVACLAARRRGQAPSPPSIHCSSLRPRDCRCTVTTTAGSRLAATSTGRQANGTPVLQQAVVSEAADRTVRVLLRPTVLRCQRGGLLLGDTAQACWARSQRVPLHHGLGRHPAGRVRAGMWPDKPVRPSSAGRRLGRWHMRVSALPGLLGPRRRRSYNRR